MKIVGISVIFYYLSTQRESIFCHPGPVCVDPGFPDDGQVQLESVEEGAQAKFTCNRAGYKPFPSDTINCTLGTACVLAEDVGISSGFIPDGAFADNSDSTTWGYEPHKVTDKNDRINLLTLSIIHKEFLKYETFFFCCVFVLLTKISISGSIIIYWLVWFQGCIYLSFCRFTTYLYINNTTHVWRCRQWSLTWPYYQNAAILQSSIQPKL